MDKRYQVFLSSTYEDLRKERAEVILALLELDCIPSGMELFPAADESTWDIIKRSIDECDYYILVIGGKYGSISPDNISWTEREFRYATEIGKPRLAFIHGEPGKIISEKTEQTDEGKKKLKEFKAFVERERICKYWKTPGDLGGVVSRSMTRLIKTIPAVGWIRGDEANDDLKNEILELRRKLDKTEVDLLTATEKLNSLTLKDFDIKVFYKEKIKIKANIHFSISNGLPYPNRDYSHITREYCIELPLSDVFLAVAPEITNVPKNQVLCINQIARRYFGAGSDMVKKTMNLQKNWEVVSENILSESKNQIKSLLCIKYNLIELSPNENKGGDLWSLSQTGLTLLKKMI